jgi:hypothetical protein
MDTLHDVIVWLLVGAVVIGFVINAAYMLVSPRAWSRLPSWLRAKGSYSVGRDGLLVRIGGAILLGTMLWILYDAFLRR